MALLLIALSVSGLLWLYITSLDSDVTETLVSRGELVTPQPRVYVVQCSEDYENYKRYPGVTQLLSLYSASQSTDTSLLCKYNWNEIKPNRLYK